MLFKFLVENISKLPFLSQTTGSIESLLPYLFVFFGREIVEEEIDRVDFLAVLDDFIMHVRTGRRSRIPYIAYDISSLYFLSRPYRELAHMSIQGGIPITMIDDDMIPIASAVIFHFRHNAIPCRINFCSDRVKSIPSCIIWVL